MQLRIGLLHRVRAVVAVLLAGCQIDRRLCCGKCLQIPIPLGGDHEEGCVQLRPHPHHERAGLSAAGVALQIDPVRVNVISIHQAFRQCYSLTRRGLAPVVKLRRDHDHLFVPANGQRDKQRVRFPAVIGIRDIAAVMNIPQLGMINVVIHKAALCLCPAGDGSAVGFRRSRSAAREHERKDEGRNHNGNLHPATPILSSQFLISSSEEWLMR